MRIKSKNVGFLSSKFKLTDKAVWCMLRSLFVIIDWYESFYVAKCSHLCSKYRMGRQVLTCYGGVAVQQAEGELSASAVKQVATLGSYPSCAAPPARRHQHPPIALLPACCWHSWSMGVVWCQAHPFLLLQQQKYALISDLHNFLSY